MNKKILASIAAAVAIITIAILILVNGYFKEVEVYTVNNSEISAQKDRAGKVELTFELAKELNYEVKNQSSYSVEFKNPDNLSTIEVRLLDSTKEGIIMGEGDFRSEGYQDYQTFNRHGHEGYQVFYRAELFTEFETAMLLNEYQYSRDDKSDTAYDGIKITVIQSPLSEGESFNVEEFINSEDFQHLIDSIKFTYKN